MRRTIPLLATMALTLLLASGLALAAGVGSAAADSSVVGPGESIQKAINAADPGDTIVVRGVHREDVVIRKDGIKLRGEDAVIEAPAGAKADSPCSRSFGTEGVCVLGDVNLETGQITGPRVKDVSVSGFTFRDFEDTGGDFGVPQVIDVYAARDATVAGNRLIGNVTMGIGATDSVGETIAKNRVIGSPETRGDGIIVQDSSHTKVVENVVRNIRDHDTSAIAVESNSIDTTVAGNDLEDNWLGVLNLDSPGTTILSNDISRFGIFGTLVAGQKSQDAKLVGNHISGGPWGIFVTDARQGSLVGNTVRDNCAGIWFEAFGPVGGYKVTGNTVAENTRSCQGQKFGRKFSGIGIALLGASGMEVTGNHLWGNVPSGPTPISGGVVVATDPYFGVKAKPNNNTVSANHFGRNKPDIFYDGSGSGNRFVGNLCDTSVPTRLCN